MGRRRDFLAVQVVIVSFAAAVRSFGTLPDRDMGMILIEQARDRALHLLDATAANLPYEPNSPLDHVVREARQRIESHAASR